MKIVVLVKEVPDTYGDRKLGLETGLADRSGDRVVDEICERALEAAITLAGKAGDTEVVVLSMAGEAAQATVRKGLAMGAASAVQVIDEQLVGADVSLTAQVLAAALRRIGFDLVIAGNQSTDGSGGVVPAMVAELLDVPQLTALNTVEVDGDRVSGERAIDGGTARVSTTLPAVVSITERMPDPRLPSFKGIMAAKKKPFETLSLADLDVDADAAAQPWSIMTAVAERPARTAGVKITDTGDAGEQLAKFLVDNRLA
ncbi:MAG TPA: electron transfer flavoprotein subunit beta/FixA family protein [Microbacterium sp.]|nr:electron transfer flavoprotein subunit beta/FixA family protein [Microbacterium sp.]